MSKLTAEQHVNAAPEQVWGVVSDLDSWAAVVSGIKTVQRLDGSPEFGVGTSWRETRVMFGKESTEDMTVSKVDPGRSYTVEAESHGAHYTSVITLAPSDSGTYLTMTFTATTTSTLAAILSKTIGKLFEGSTRKALAQDLQDIATAAETRD